jgi:hypothetical protein
MSEPTQAEIAAVIVALVNADSPGCEQGAIDWALWRDDSGYWRKLAESAIEISKVARLLNNVEWLVGWVPAGLVEVR